MRCLQATFVEATLNVMPASTSLFLSSRRSGCEAVKELDFTIRQQLVVRVVLEFLEYGLRLDAGARLIRRRRCCCLGLFSQRNGHGCGVGLGGGGGLVRCAWGHLRGRVHVGAEGLLSKTRASRA
jgi:hypothetical protein